MNPQEAQLFNQMFVDFLKQYLLRDTGRKYSTSEIADDMPQFYKSEHLISAGLQVLLRNYEVDHLLHDGRDYYKISDKAVDAINKAKENERLNKEFDLEIKRRTIQGLKWDRMPKRYWLVIAVIAFLVGGFSDLAKEYIKVNYIDKKAEKSAPSSMKADSGHQANAKSH